MKIGVDDSGKVWLVGDAIPEEFNGMALKTHVLTDDLEKAFAALPADRGGTMFDGQKFSPLPAPPPAVQKTAVDQILADPKELAKLRKALGTN